MEREIIICVLETLDRLLAPKEPGGPGMENTILNYPNLAKIRRVIGSDDDEINELLTQKGKRISAHVTEMQARLRKKWKDKLDYNKKKGKLTKPEKEVFNLMKSGGHWHYQAIVDGLIPTTDKTLSSLTTLLKDVTSSLYELDRRGLIDKITNANTRKPEDLARFQWFVVGEDERRIFAGLKPSAAYIKNTPKLEVSHVNLQDQLTSELLAEAIELLKVIPGQAGETVTIEYASRVGEFLERTVL